MACPSTCENPPEPTGARGVCDNITGLCICPPGFDGKDIWRDFNDCHIDQAFRRQFVLATFVLNVTAVVVSVLVLSRLLYHYLRSFKCKTSDQPFDDRAAVAAMKNEQKLRVRRAQKWRIIMLVTLQLLTCLFALPYSVSILFYSPSVFRYEEPYFLDACLALSHIALFSSYWISSYVWFKLLPALPHIARLYNMKSFIFDRPDIVPKVALVNTAVVIVVEFVVTFLLPTLFFDDPERRNVLDTVGIIAKMIFCVSFAVPAMFYISAAARLLNESLYQMEDVDPSSLKFIGRGKRTVRFVRGTLTLLVTLWIGLFLPTLVTDYGRRNVFAFYSPVLCVALVGMISSNINVGIRMAETVDLAASMPREQKQRSERKRSKFVSRMSRLAVRDLLMGGKETEDDS